MASTNAWDNVKVPGKDAVDPAKSLIQQQRMAKATNPWNSQTPNDLGTSTNVQDRPGKLESLQAAPAATAPEYSKPVDQKTASVIDPNAQRIQSVLGSKAYDLQAKINSFLTKGTQNIAGTSKATNTWDQASGTWKTGDVSTDMNAAVDPLVQQKVAEQKALQTEMQQYFDKDPVTGEYKPKGFYQVLQQEGGNEPGLNGMLNIAEQLNSLENMNMGNSEEARELQRRLHEMDKDGLVTGLYRAKQQYEETFGTKDKAGLSWYGDATGQGGAGGGYSTADILGLTEKDIRQEVENAAEMASGLFGGSFEAGLKQAVDTESAAYKQAKQQDAELNTQLSKVASDYFTVAKDAMTKAGNDLNTKIKDSAAGILEGLKNDTSAEGREAYAWMNKLMSGNDPVGAITKMMLDPTSGLNRDQRAKLGEYLGESMFGKGGGKLANWLTQLSSTGQITKEDGTQVNVTAQQKADLMNILSSGGPDASAKAAAYLKDNIVKTAGYNLEDAVKTATSEGNLSENLKKITTTMTDSFKSFMGSQTENAVIKALNITPEQLSGLTPDQKATLFADTINKYPDDISSLLASTASAKAQEEVEAFNKSKASLTSSIAAKRKETESVKSNLQASTKKFSDNIAKYGEQITNDIASNFSKVNTDASRLAPGISSYLNQKYPNLPKGTVENVAKTSAFIRRMAGEVSSGNEYSKDLQVALSDFKGILPADLYNAMVSGGNISPTDLVERLTTFTNTPAGKQFGSKIDSFIKDEPKALASNTPSFQNYFKLASDASKTVAGKIKEIDDLYKSFDNTEAEINKTADIVNQYRTPDSIAKEVIASLGTTGVDMGNFDPNFISNLTAKIGAGLTKGYGTGSETQMSAGQKYVDKDIKDIDYGIPKYVAPKVTTAKAPVEKERIAPKVTVAKTGNPNATSDYYDSGMDSFSQGMSANNALVNSTQTKAADAARNAGVQATKDAAYKKWAESQGLWSPGMAHDPYITPSETLLTPKQAPAKEIIKPTKEVKEKVVKESAAEKRQNKQTRNT